MKRTAGFSLFFLLLTLTVPFKTYPEEVEKTPSPPPFIGLVTGRRVNCRAAPRLTSEVVFQIRKGDKIHVLSKQDSWYGVELPSEASVFVGKSFLNSDNGSARVEGKRVQVRAGPGEAYSSIGFLSDQEVVRVRKIIGGWAEIDPPPTSLGWVNESYITFFSKEEQGASR